MPIKSSRQFAQQAVLAGADDADLASVRLTRWRAATPGAPPGHCPRSTAHRRPDAALLGPWAICRATKTMTLGNKDGRRSQVGGRGYRRSSGVVELVQPGAEEAVDAVEFRQMAWEGAQIAVRRDPLVLAPYLLGGDWPARDGRSRAQQEFDLPRSLFRFERTGAIDQRAAGHQHLDRGAQQIGLDHGQTRDVVGGFEVRYIGMTTDRPGRRTGCIEQHGADRPRR